MLKYFACRGSNQYVLEIIGKPKHIYIYILMCCYHYFIRNLGNQYIYICWLFFQYMFLFTNDQNQQIEYSTKSLHTYLHMSCIRAIYCKTYHQRPVAMVFAEKWLPTPGNQREQELRKLKDKKKHSRAP